MIDDAGACEPCLAEEHHACTLFRAGKDCSCVCDYCFYCGEFILDPWGQEQHNCPGFDNMLGKVVFH